MPDTFTTVPVEIIADWQILGDVNPLDYMVGLLDAAVVGKKITDWKINDIAGGRDFYFVSFKVQMNFTAHQLNFWKESATSILNEIVHDTDVDVRWITRV